MKKILSLLWTITLIGTSATSLVACNTPNEYTPEQLKEQKEKNKIDTANQEIRDNLEWMAPQEKPFNTVDNKWYYVVWKGQNWNITKFKNYEEIIPPKHEYRYKTIDEKSKYKIQLRHYSRNDSKINLIIFKSINEPTFIWEENSNNFKSVYRWNLYTQEPDLILDENGIVKVNGK